MAYGYPFSLGVVLVLVLLSQRRVFFLVEIIGVFLRSTLSSLWITVWLVLRIPSHLPSPFSFSASTIPGTSSHKAGCGSQDRAVIGHHSPRFCSIASLIWRRTFLSSPPLSWNISNIGLLRITVLYQLRRLGLGLGIHFSLNLPHHRLRITLIPPLAHHHHTPRSRTCSTSDTSRDLHII